MDGMSGDWTQPAAALPDNLIVPHQYKEVGPGILKPVFGYQNTQVIKFFINMRYNPRLSELENREVLEPVECYEIINDQYCSATGLVSHNPEITVKYAEIYQRFKNQEESVGTPVEKWPVINDRELALLRAQNVVCVEQLAEMEDRVAQGKFGNLTEGLLKKARQHVEGKKINEKGKEQLEQIDAMRAEMELERERMQQKEQEFLAREADIARRLEALEVQETEEPKRKRGRPRKDEVTQDE